MANTIRKQIRDAIVTLLGDISTIKNVEYNRKSAWPQGDLPAITVYSKSGGDNLEGVLSRDEHLMQVNLEARFIGETSNDDIDAGIGDIYAAIDVDKTFGVAGVSGIQDRTYDIDTVEENAALQTVEITYNVRY